MPKFRDGRKYIEIGTAKASRYFYNRPVRQLFMNERRNANKAPSAETINENEETTQMNEEILLEE